MSLKTTFVSVKSWLKTNTVSAVLILVILAMSIVMVVLFTRQNQSTNAGPSLKTEEPISQSPVASQPAETQPAPAAQAESGTTKLLFCLQLDGRQDGHLPALMGSEAQNAYPNGLDGSNWNLTANSTGDEDYGLLPNKLVFAKEAFLKKWGMVSSVAIKCDQTGWAPIKLQKGVVNGQPAYTYQAK